MRFLQAQRESKRRQDEGENKMIGGPSSNKSGDGGEGGAPSGPAASPQARQLAKELGVDLAAVEGTGAGGLITAGDIRKTHEAQNRGSRADFSSGGGIGRD